MVSPLLKGRTLSQTRPYVHAGRVERLASALLRILYITRNPESRATGKLEKHNASTEKKKKDWVELENSETLIAEFSGHILLVRFSYIIKLRLEL